MATFKFGRYIDIHWNGYDIQGPADTVFSIPDQLYEEFDADIAPVEPTLQWIDTNEFQTLSNSVSASSLSATFPIALTTSSTGKTISFSSSTNPNGYLLAADGSGGVIFTPASTSGLTSVVGVSPISTAVSGGTVSVSINQAELSVSDAATATVLRTYVKNSSGSTITKGQVVYITGADGTNALIGLASNTSDASSSKTLGIAANTMTNNAFGYVIENGQLSNIDTSAATAGSAVWLGSTPGSYQFTVPAEPNHAVYLGVVTKANVSTGEILVKVQNGYELNELHDVFTTGVSSSLPLVYNATSDGWIAQALSSVGIADNAIVTTKILDGAVTSAKLATDSVGAAAISAGAIGTSELATGSVVSAKIATGAVTSGHIATGAVGSAALAASSVVSAAIAANAVTSGHIAAGAVGSAQIATGAVVAGDIAANAVTSGNIASGSVDTSKISSGAAANGTVLTANGSGGATFQSASIGSVTKTTLTGSGTWVVPTGVNTIKAILLVDGGSGGGRGGLTTIVGTPTTGTSSGGASGRSGFFQYAENIYLGSNTSFTYAVGSGGAGQAAATFSKVATGTTTTSLAAGADQANGVSSTFGSFTFPIAYLGNRVVSTSGADNTNNAQNPANETAATFLLGAVTINQQIYNATDSTDVIGYWKPSDNFVNGNSGGSASSTITGATPTVSTGTAAAGGTMTAWMPASGGGGNWSAATTPVERTAAAGIYGGSGGGAPIRVRLGTGTTTVTSLIAGDGGNGVNGIGAAGAGGGSAILTAASTTDYNASTITNMESGAGGNGGNGTIIIWY